MEKKQGGSEQLQKEERKRLTREIAAARTESKMSEIINTGRKGRKRVKESTEKEQWKEYFMGLLGGGG